MNLTRDRYFIDTNILVYIFNSDKKNKSEIAGQILKNALLEGNGCISFQVIQEFCNVALKKFEVPLSLEDCKTFINRFLYPICAVHPGIELYNTALDIRKNANYSYYDCLILAAAYQSECKTLFSEDLQSGQIIAGVKIVNPF